MNIKGFLSTTLLTMTSAAFICGCGNANYDGPDAEVSIVTDASTEEVSVENSSDEAFNNAYPDVTYEILDAYDVSFDSEPNFSIYEISFADLADIYGKEDCYVYVGASWCPSCQGFAPEIFEALNEKGISIYYVNNDKYERTQYTIDPATNSCFAEQYEEDYERCLDVLGRENFEDYIIVSEDGTEYDTGSQRIFLPTLMHLTYDGFETYDGIGLLATEKELDESEHIDAVADISDFVSHEPIYASAQIVKNPNRCNIK
ncbi:hypothetical protein [Butyrivibrio proteoclasticus]|uniref:hypothetical protein n=1 Tax=Butyrivibrio proteoclasticus TaxID=43305 RepID=UPI00047C1F5C|nr:hypothetical protein [Butyrivibrio proteoclasticus]